MAVVFFHLELFGFVGGFVGVDMFFVISGYLITRNIMRDLNGNGFSFKRFYIARLRRLMPALFVTIALSLVFGYLLFSPDALIRLSGSAIAGVVSLASIQFWMSSGYFDVGADLKPLLHLWSLSVEEQFYLFWPLILVLLVYWLKSNRSLFIVIAMIALASLTASQVLLNGSPEMAFFWAHTRAYEFLIGALYAWKELNTKSVQINSANQLNPLLVILSLLVLAYCFIEYDKSVAFPGLAALLPCFATVALISQKETLFVKTLLANNVMSWVGRISYSVYLVHWPVWVYWVFWSNRTPDVWEKSLMLALIFLLGYLLNTLVEKRFRIAKNSEQAQPKNTGFLISLTLSAAAILLFSWFVRTNHGLPERLPQAVEKYQSSTLKCALIENDLGKRKCALGASTGHTIKILLLGDSHSLNLYDGFDKFGNEHSVSIETLTYIGCPPLLGVSVKSFDKSETNQACLEFTERFARIVEETDADVVALSARWMRFYEHQFYYHGFDGAEAYLSSPLDPASAHEPTHELSAAESSRQTWHVALKRTIDSITARGKKVIVFSQYPVLHNKVGECDKSPGFLIDKRKDEERCSTQVPYDKIMQRLEFTNGVIEALESNQVMAILPSDYLCDHELKTCNVFSNSGLLYYDHNHLSSQGSLYLIGEISSLLREFLRLE